MLRGCASIRWLSVSLVVGHVLAVGGCLLVAVGVRECYVCCERFLSKRATRGLPIRKTQRALADICPPLNLGLDFWPHRTSAR